MNYQVITDEKLLKEFIDSLPDLDDDLVFYCCLFARSKYLKEENKGKISHITSDKAQLKRFVANKKTLLTKLKQLECPEGSYLQYKQDVPDRVVLQETLAVYMTINPRSLSKATRTSIKKFVDMMVDNAKHNFNPSNFAMSEIQRSKGRTDWVIFDLDSKEFTPEELKLRVSLILDGGEFKILETRGGYHIMVKPDSPKNKRWHQDMTGFFTELDQTGDIMIPIPGTHQGGFTPKFI